MTVNNYSMTVNYCSILTLEIIGFFTVVIYYGKLPWYFYNICPWLKRKESFLPLPQEIYGFRQSPERDRGRDGQGDRRQQGISKRPIHLRVYSPHGKPQTSLINGIN